MYSKHKIIWDILRRNFKNYQCFGQHEMFEQLSRLFMCNKNGLVFHYANSTSHHHQSSFNSVFSSSTKVAEYTSLPPRSLSLLPSISFDLQPDFLYTLFHLPLPCHFWPSSLSLSIHFHHHCLLQYIIIFSSNQMSIPSYSIRLCHSI